jgi:hypothetical protein
MSVHINHLAVWIASAMYFVIGGMWYAPFLFGKKWMALNRFSEADRAANLKASGGMGAFLGVSFAGGVISIFALACLLSAARITTSVGAALAGLLAGIAFVLVHTTVNNLFSLRSFKLTLIDAGYAVIAFTISGAIFGAWQ